MTQFGDGVVADPQDETADPSHDLRMAVRLNPRGCDALGGAPAADRDQVPDAQKGTRQQHEK
jgi:hypothetical protein